MLSSNLTKEILKAFSIAFIAHKGQRDKGGNDYILHPLRIALNLPPALIPIALLHDVVEDTPLTLEDLKKLGISDKTVQSVNVLTKKQTCNYEEYLSGIMNDSLALQVKIQDILDNLDLSRIPKSFITEKDHDRQRKYETALEFLLTDLLQKENS